MLKLQSALEYLTTYGWAILIIAIVLVTLFELGLFTPKPNTQCIIEAGFSCSGYTLNSQGVLEFTLNQQTSNPVNITGIACYENGTLLTGQAPYNPPSNEVFMPVGTSTAFYVQCYSGANNKFSGDLGSYFHGSIAIYYTDAITHLTELAEGSLIIPVTSTQQILTSGNPSNQNTFEIKLTDITSQAVSSGFQQKIVIDPSSYAKYGLNANLSNLEFTTGEYGSGSPIYSWIESGASNTATSSVIWLSLPTGITANGGTQTIYMNFFSNNNPVLSGYTGYAPQLYCSSKCYQSSYAQFDTGTKVFTDYWNFAGTSTPNGWTTSTSGLINDGLSLSNGNWAQTSSTSYGINSNQIIDFYANTPYVTACNWYGFGYYTVATANGLIWGDDACTGSHSILPLVTGPNALPYSGEALNGGLPSLGNYLLSVYWGANGKNEYYYNYQAYASESNTLSMPGVTTGLGGIWSDANAITINYLRVRQYPPDGQMPSVDIVGLLG